MKKTDLDKLELFKGAEDLQYWVVGLWFDGEDIKRILDD